MHPEDPTDTSLAVQQWQTLYDTYLGLGFEVNLIDPIEGLPDMVYAANGGFVLDGIAYGASFPYPQRAPEGPAYMDWFRANGFEVREPVEVNEGEGDFLLVGDVILAGTGFRTNPASHAGDRASLRPRGRSPSSSSTRASTTSTPRSPCSTRSRERALEHRLPPLGLRRARPRRARRRYPDAIIVTDEDAAVSASTPLSDGHNVVIASRAKDFERQLRERGYNPIGVDLSELLLGGGGVKCCTLELRR